MRKSATMLLSAALLCVLFSGCSGGGQPLSTPEQELSSAVNEEATADEGGEPVSVESVELVPIYGDQIDDDTYTIDVSSSSSMFRIVDAQLTVNGDEMSAVLTLSGTGYEKLYMGTAEAALADTDDKCIYYTENAEGQFTYEVPVAALDQEMDVAAWSIRKQKWYDRVLVFQSSQIPEEAITTA